jgi:hypothetical protein
LECRKASHSNGDIVSTRLIPGDSRESVARDVTLARSDPSTASLLMNVKVLSDCASYNSFAVDDDS